MTAWLLKSRMTLSAPVADAVKVISKSRRLRNSRILSRCKYAHDGALPSLRAAMDTSVKGGDFVGPGNFLHLTGSPTIQACSKRTRNFALGSQLWERAQDLTGIRYL